MRRTYPTVLLVAAMVLVACGGAGDETGGPLAPPTDSATEQPVESEDAGPDDRPRSPLTGLPIDPEVRERPLLVVKIDNAARARPQTGLEAADIVIEELVEGGATRFMALFHTEFPEVVGPVRSARPVDVDLLGGFGAAGFLFSGAREEVRGLLATTPSVLLLDQPPAFFRDASRAVPREHTLYVNLETAARTVLQRGARTLIDFGWTFDATIPDGALECPASAVGCPDPGTAIVVDMSARNEFGWSTGWTYDAAAGVYRRQQDGVPFRVTGSDELGADNVIILGTRRYVGAAGWTETDATADQAPALVLRDGRRYAARWSKPTAGDLIEVTTPDGRPFPLKPGVSWVLLPDAAQLPTVG
jgi:hypothetical protein